MLVKKDLLAFITEKLAHFKALVATQNAISFFDINIVAEDFFCELLNVVYDYSLINLNHADLNAAAVDLGDRGKRVAVQVTSERTKAKVQKTINRFAANGLADDYDVVKILIIGDRTGNYPTLKIPAGVSFNGKTDVIDIKNLTKKISTLSVEKLREIAEVIRTQTEPTDAPKAGSNLVNEQLSSIVVKGHQLEDMANNLSYVVVTVQNVSDDSFPPYTIAFRNRRGIVYKGAFSQKETGELLSTQKREHELLLKGNPATDGFLGDERPEDITLIIQLEDSDKILFESRLLGRSLTEAHQTVDRNGTIGIKDPVWWRMDSAAEMPSSVEASYVVSDKNPDVRFRSKKTGTGPIK